MPEADPFPKVKRAIIRALSEFVVPLGFQQYRKTVYFIRDRGPIRDIFFVQKMRSNAVSIAYGVTAKPDDDDEWTPGVPNARWLNRQESYRSKYVEHVAGSIGRATTDFESEALPWFASIETEGDLAKTIA
ncbi:hypothetical protein [Rhodopirellula baltica]|uniref:Uncharacterized protein n=1 Tax=Rhodopirellula baltica SWK14 TaxID=993516 RepID=L7CCV9_RHOBT|nr:hypothetical protein [Rhodopirellula baltica]ELP32029.1 hypothetical protein RBSWK_04027 [Rhodopirellula baltica SWK14]